MPFDLILIYTMLGIIAVWGLGEAAYNVAFGRKSRREESELNRHHVDF